MYIYIYIYDISSLRVKLLSEWLTKASPSDKRENQYNRMTTESQKEMKAGSTRQTVLQLLVFAGVYEVSTNLGTTSKF